MTATDDRARVQKLLRGGASVVADIDLQLSQRRVARAVDMLMDSVADHADSCNCSVEQQREGHFPNGDNPLTWETHCTIPQAEGVGFATVYMRLMSAYGAPAYTQNNLDVALWERDQGIPQRTAVVDLAASADAGLRPFHEPR